MKFTEAEDNFIKENYLTIPSKRIAKMLGRSEGTARQRMKLLGIIVPPEIVQKFREDSYIKKGSVPFNKGKKITEFMTKEAIANSKVHRYKKGHLPHNAKKNDFTITIRPDKRGIKYKFIRISLGNWIPLARYNWEKANGPIAKNMKIIHKDGDTLNCEFSNLELLTPGELMKRNSLHNLPEDISKTILLGAALTRKINRKTKTLHEKQD